MLKILAYCYIPAAFLFSAANSNSDIDSFSALMLGALYIATCAVFVAYMTALSKISLRKGRTPSYFATVKEKLFRARNTSMRLFLFDSVVFAMALVGKTRIFYRNGFYSLSDLADISPLFFTLMSLFTLSYFCYSLKSLQDLNFEIDERSTEDR